MMCGTATLSQAPCATCLVALSVSFSCLVVVSVLLSIPSMLLCLERVELASAVLSVCQFLPTGSVFVLVLCVFHNGILYRTGIRLGGVVSLRLRMLGSAMVRL